MEKEYKIDNEAQLNKALKYLDTLGYEWMSGSGLTDWKPDTCVDDFPIVLNVGEFGSPNTVTYRLLIDIGIDYKSSFDNILDAPDYSGVEGGSSGEVDTVTEEGQTANEIFSEFLGELTELLGLTEDEGLEFDDGPEDDERYEEKDTTYTVRLTNGETICVAGYKGLCDSDFLANSDFLDGSGTNKLTAKQLFMYLTGEHVEPDSITTGKADIRQGLDNIKTIEVDGTHEAGEFESDVRFTVIADGKHVTIDRYLRSNNDYQVSDWHDEYDGNELTFDELLAFITGEGDVHYYNHFKEIQSITVVTPDEETVDDTPDEETVDDTPDEDTLANTSEESDETKFIIRLTNRRVVWRVPNDAYMDIAGPMNGFELKSKDRYLINPYWDYHLTVGELAEAISLIDLSELASISIVD